MTSLRIFFVGGLISFRALFNWLSPWIYVPSMLVAPIVQILLFAYMGRAAGVESDEFYLIGNAVQYSAIPCLFAMANTVAGERYTQTLGIVLVTPANRVALFLGRSLPVVVNGAIVSMFSLVVGALLLGVRLPAGSWLPLAVIILIAAVSCTGLGLANAALGLRVRETAVMSNVLFGLLLIFSGANVPVDALPGVDGLGVAVAPAHARDRGGPRGRRRRHARLGVRPDRPRARPRDPLRRDRSARAPAARGGGPPPRDAGDPVAPA